MVRPFRERPVWRPGAVRVRADLRRRYQASNHGSLGIRLAAYRQPVSPPWPARSRSAGTREFWQSHRRSHSPVHRPSLRTDRSAWNREICVRNSAGTPSPAMRPRKKSRRSPHSLHFHHIWGSARHWRSALARGVRRSAHIGSEPWYLAVYRLRRNDSHMRDTQQSCHC
jgi:hypothetical protein